MSQTVLRAQVCVKVEDMYAEVRGPPPGGGIAVLPCPKLSISAQQCSGNGFVELPLACQDPPAKITASTGEVPVNQTFR